MPGKRNLRRTEHRLSVLNALQDFRYKYWVQHYKRCAWGPEALLSDKNAAFLARNAQIRTVEDIKLWMPHWRFGSHIGELALAAIDAADDRWYATEGKVNPRKVPKIVETKRQTQDRYNANKREKRRRVSEAKKSKANAEPSGSTPLEPEELKIDFYNPALTQISIPSCSSQAVQLSTTVSVPSNLVWTSNLDPHLLPTLTRSTQSHQPCNPSSSTSPPIASSSRVQLNDESQTSQQDYESQLFTFSLAMPQPSTMPSLSSTQPTQSTFSAQPFAIIPMTPESGSSSDVHHETQTNRRRPQPRQRIASSKTTFDYHMRL